MNPSPPVREGGFLLVTVVVILTVLAAMALLVSNTTSMDVALVDKHADRAALDYLTEAGLAHAEWQLAQNTSCSGYIDVPVTNFASGSYSVAVAPTTDSPVTLTAVGALPDGTQRTLARGVKAYQAPVTTTLQPGAEAEDTYIWDGAHKDTNFGTTAYMELNNQSAERVILMRFDLSSIPTGAIITGATLELWLESGGGLNNGVIDAHRITQTWFEGEEDDNPPTTPGATYLDYDGSTGAQWANPGGDYDPTAIAATTIPNLTPGWYQWDVSALATGASPSALETDGVLLRASGGDVDKIRFTSSDGAAAQRPKLIVAYACECGIVCGGSASTQPIAHWQLDDASGSQATDTVGGNHGTLVNGPTWTSGRLDGGLSFDENDDYVRVADFTYGPEFTVSFDMKLDDNDGSLFQYVFGHGDINSTHSLNVFITESSHGTDPDVLRTVIRDSNDALDNFALQFDIGTIIGDGNWHTYTLTVEAGVGAKVYFDGVLKQSGNFGGDDFNPTTDLFLGARQDLNAGRLYGGSLDEVRIYDKALTAGEVADLADGAGSTNTQLLFVVGDPSNLSTTDSDKIALIESWGYAVNLIDDSATQADLDKATAANDVVYVSEEVDHMQLVDKLRNAPTGIVVEEQYLHEEFGFSANRSRKLQTQIDVTDNSHYITSEFPLGLVTIYTSDQMSSMVINPGASVQILAELNNVGPNWDPTLATIDTGDEMYGGGAAPARRVKVPFEVIDVSALNTNGQTIMRRAIEWATGTGDSSTGPIAHWQLDETSGTEAFDYAGGHHGEVLKGATWNPAGQINGALEFDGVDDHVEVPHDDALSLTSAFTISAWIYNQSSSFSGSYRIVSKEPTGSNAGVWLSTQAGSFWMGIGGNFFSPPISLEVDRWYHVAGSFDDATDQMAMYVNGVRVLGESTTATIAPNTDPLIIGGNWEGFKFWHGLLDDVRIYDRMLTADEVAALAASGGGGGGGSGTCDATIADDFQTGTYTGSSGTADWASAWEEFNDDGDPRSGDERIELVGDNYDLRVQDNDGGGEGVTRAFSLSGATNVRLSFDYWREGLDRTSDYVALEISPNGGGSWIEIDRFAGPENDGGYQLATHDISGHISADVVLRLITSSTMGGSDRVYFDNIEICIKK